MTKALRAASDLPLQVCCMRQHTATITERKRRITVCIKEGEEREEREKEEERKKERKDKAGTEVKSEKEGMKFGEGNKG